MTTFRQASAGVGWMLGTQLVIGAGQFAYSAITARAFSPAEFGSFSAALGLVGILILLTTTGLPSVVLRERELSRIDVGWIRGYALVGGCAAGGAYVLLAPLWIQLLRAPDATQFLGLLALSLVLGPVASVEASLLRREGRPIADAVSFLLAFIVPTAIAVVATISIRQAWVLAIASVLAPLALGLSSALLRRQRYASPGGARHLDLLGFSGRVSAHNLAFLLIGQVQGWVLSATLGAAFLGQYSRATTLANTPASAFSTALNRAVQPHWRKLGDDAVAARAMRETTLLTASLALPAFGVLAALGSPFTALWLGPGWDAAARCVPWLAVAGGLGVTFTVLVTSLEMRDLFRSVRVGQVGLAVGVGIGLIIFIGTKDLGAAAAGVLISQAFGLLALLSSIARGSRIPLRTLLWALALPALWAAAVAAVALATSALSLSLGLQVFGSRELSAVALGAAVAAAFWLGTFRWQPAGRVLEARGIRLPGLLASRAAAN